jgi:hypothetical protein
VKVIVLLVTVILGLIAVPLVALAQPPAKAPQLGFLAFAGTTLRGA